MSIRPLNTCFSSPLSPAGGLHFWRVMVVKITNLVGNGRQIYKFNSSKNQSGILSYFAGTDGITCTRKSRGDEKQLIDLEWPNNLCNKQWVHI